MEEQTLKSVVYMPPDLIDFFRLIGEKHAGTVVQTVFDVMNGKELPNNIELCVRLTIMYVLSYNDLYKRYIHESEVDDG